MLGRRMGRVIRLRATQPDTSFGMLVAGILLVLFYNFWEINIFTVLICIFTAPFVNWLTVGRTHKTEIHIDKD